MTERLCCHIGVVRDDSFPGDDAHPLWAEIDALGERTISSDAPLGSFYFWIELPAERAIRSQRLSICLDHLTRARNAFPDAGWEVRIEEWDGVTLTLRPIVWCGGEFRDEFS